MALIDSPARTQADILTPAALSAVAELHEEFDARRRELLAARHSRRENGLPTVSREAVEGDWQVAPPPPALTRRQVELTSPATRKFARSAMDSGADVWLADLEDSFSPTWANVVEAHSVLADVVSGAIAPASGSAPTLMLRPRGLHLIERHVSVAGEPVAAPFLDVGLFVHHHGAALAARGQGPFLYLPKIESVPEAQLWRDVLEHLERRIGVPHGTIRAAILVETLPAALVMEDILMTLRHHAVGLNAGRWDYLFSVLKEIPDAPLPDREDVTMTSWFMRAFTERLVAACHRRGTHAIAGPTAVLPRGETTRGTGLALARVRVDTDTFAQGGFDGSWVAHPQLVPVIRDVYQSVMCGREDQRERVREDHIDDDEVLDFTSAGGSRTMDGLRSNIRVALRYLCAWLGGRGSVVVDGVMEDAATAEIARIQVRQWIRQRTLLDEGITVTSALVRRLLENEAVRLHAEGGMHTQRLPDAVALVIELVEGPEVEYLTELAYPRLEG